MTEHEAILLTAQGMIRNFGDKAAQQAESVALRHKKPNQDGEARWDAIAKEIRAMAGKMALKSSV